MEPHPRYLVGLLSLLCVAIGGPMVAWHTACTLWPARWTIAATLAAVEWCFYIFYFRRSYEEFNKIPASCKPKAFTPTEGRKNWQRFLKTVCSIPGGVDPQPYLTQWFCNAPFDEIKRGNVEEMLVYGFYYAKRSDLQGELAHVPAEMVDDLESALKVKFPPGYNPNLRFMSHLWEDLRAHYRPLCMYLFFEALYGAQRLIMASYGFKAKRLGLLGYYTLNCGLDFPQPAANSLANDCDADDWTPFAAPAPPKPTENPLCEAVPKTDKATPVMFLHGVGGLMLYLEMLKHVIGLGHPVIVIEYKHVAMRLSSYIPTVDEVTENVVRILDHEGISRVCVVGHSYGSFMASRLNALHQERLHSLCLIDPVCLGMFMPHLLHNFMYRRPRIDWKHPDVLIRDLALWFASRDVHISATFARRFYWSDLNLWPEDLPPGSCIVLSGNDDLCHAEEVKKMLDASGRAKVILNPHLFHGAFLLDSSSKAHLMVEVRALLASSGSLVVRLARPVMDRTLSAARSLLQEVETLTTRLSHINPQGSLRQQQQQEHRQGSRALRRTLTDLPAHAWQRVASFGPAQRIASFTGRSPTAAAAAAAAQEDAERHDGHAHHCPEFVAQTSLTGDCHDLLPGAAGSITATEQRTDASGDCSGITPAAPAGARDDSQAATPRTRKKNLSTIPSLPDILALEGTGDTAAGNNNSDTAAETENGCSKKLMQQQQQSSVAEAAAGAAGAVRPLQQQQQQQQQHTGTGSDHDDTACNHSSSSCKDQLPAAAGLVLCHSEPKQQGQQLQQQGFPGDSGVSASTRRAFTAPDVLDTERAAAQKQQRGLRGVLPNSGSDCEDQSEEQLQQLLQQEAQLLQQVLLQAKRQ